MGMTRWATSAVPRPPLALVALRRGPVARRSVGRGGSRGGRRLVVQLEPLEG